MTTPSLLRKRVRKSIANSKGFSSVIGTAFMVLVMIFLSTSVFLWTLSENTLYNEAVRMRNQEEVDRRSENIVSSSGNYSVSGNQVTVHIILRNAGSVAVQLINLWVLDTDLSNQRYANKSLDLNLNPGDVSNLVGSNLLTVTIPGANASHNFVSWFVTGRGNTIPLEKEQAIVVAQLSQGVGSLALEFYRFRYFTYESEQRLANYPNGTSGFNVPKNTYVAFGCQLTNLDPSKQTIVIDSHSLFWQPGRPGVSEGAWFIVNVNVDGTITGTYTSVSLKYTETKMLVFASQNDLGLGAFKRLSSPNVVTAVATFLLLHGTIGSIAYAQNVPFVSLFYS